MSVCGVLVLAIHLSHLTLVLGESTTTDATQVVSNALLSLLSNQLSFCLGAFCWVLISYYVTTTYVGSHSSHSSCASVHLVLLPLILFQSCTFRGFTKALSFHFNQKAASRSEVDPYRNDHLVTRLSQAC